MFEIRDHYEFDPPLDSLRGVIHFQRWCHGSGFHYVEAGANYGVKFLYSPGEEAVAEWAWPRTLRRLRGTEIVEIHAFMRRLADHLVTPGSILLVEELPGFGRRETSQPGRETWRYHKDGWHSTHPFAYEGTAPSWAGEGARAWDIREGQYVIFPDESYRLVPRPEAWRWEHVVTPEARQGDLLAWPWEGPECVEPGREYYLCDYIPGGVISPGLTWGNKLSVFEEARGELGRHQVQAEKLVEGEDEEHHPWVIAEDPRCTHPEHTDLELGGPWLLTLAPGSSRPFRYLEDLD